MRNLKKIILINIAIISLYCIACKDKKVGPLNTSNIILRDKPLKTIKNYLKGKWQMHYTIGGISGNQRYSFVNTYLEFTFNETNNDSIRWHNDTSEMAKDIVTFERELYIFGPEYTYQINFNTLPTGFQNWVAYSIKDDTLILTDNSVDGFAYACTR